jgi:TonB-dependent SusC/RagA subfamily outer membrane receptor
MKKVLLLLTILLPVLVFAQSPVPDRPKTDQDSSEFFVECTCPGYTTISPLGGEKVYKKILRFKPTETALPKPFLKQEAQLSHYEIRDRINVPTKALIIVDGKEYNDPLYSIAFDKTESITILKDAAATSIYGVRGTLGAIVITMKKIGAIDIVKTSETKKQFTAPTNAFARTGFTLGPNPAQDKFFRIYLPQATGSFNLDLINLEGQIVERWAGNTISSGQRFNIEKIRPGFYTLVLQTSHGKKTGKLIVQ